METADTGIYSSTAWIHLIKYVFDNLFPCWPIRLYFYLNKYIYMAIILLRTKQTQMKNISIVIVVVCDVIYWNILFVIDCSGKDFCFWFFCFVIIVFYFFFRNTLFITKVCNVNLFSTIVILHDVWPIVRVLTYRPSIFKLLISFKYVNPLQYYYLY